MMFAVACCWMGHGIGYELTGGATKAVCFYEAGLSKAIRALVPYTWPMVPGWHLKIYCDLFVGFGTVLLPVLVISPDMG